MSQNRLYPIFLKLERLHTLIVGAGNVGLEKLEALINNAPEARITIVADLIDQRVANIVLSKPNINIIQRKFFSDDLRGKDVVILATDNPELHKKIVRETRQKNILTNVADTPDLCDFYLGSVVQKGDLKIGISTNGKSPTLAKRLRELFTEIFPDEIQTLLDNLHTYRNQLKGDFEHKVNALNNLTEQVFHKKEKERSEI